MKLKDIGEINPGLVTTRKKADIDYKIEKVYKLLTLNAVDENGIIYKEELIPFESIEELSDRYFTKKGDVLVRLNDPFTSIYIDKEHEGILIPSYFVNINITNENFKPGYIAWYLNSRKVKREYLRNQSGTLVASINQKIIYDLDIPEKSITEQENILSLYALYLEEMRLMEKLIYLKKEQFNGITETLLKK